MSQEQPGQIDKEQTSKISLCGEKRAKRNYVPGNVGTQDKTRAQQLVLGSALVGQSGRFRDCAQTGADSAG